MNASNEAGALAESILAYAHSLEQQRDLEISVHPFFSGSDGGFRALLPINLHTNGYCLFIKTNPDAWARCIRRQRTVLEAVRNAGGPLVGECYCGVREIVFPLNTLKGETRGFVCISGYRGGNPERRAQALVRRYGYGPEDLRCAREKLREDMPDLPSVQALIVPLLSMCKELFHLLAAELADAPPDDPRTLYARMLDYIGRNYSGRLSLAEVAKAFYCSESTVSHLFKRNSGYNFSRYVNRIRVDTAKHFLRNSEVSIHELAAYVGIQEPNYFYTVFKRETGLSPSEYRKRIRG